MANTVDTSGFVTALPSDQVKSTMDRRRYKPDHCAQYGGFRGYLIGVLYNKSDIAKNEKNPEGIFPDLVFRLKEPAPVVDANNNVVRAEPGEDILVVATHQLQSLIELAESDDYCADVTVIYKNKTKDPKSGKNLWHVDKSFSVERIAKATVVPEVGLLQSFKDTKNNPKELTSGENPF